MKFPCPLTRRAFLRSSALAAVAPAGCASLQQGNNRGSIDAHVHVWTPDTRSYPLAPGFKKSDMTPVSFTPEQLWNHCRPEGVSRVVLIQMSYYNFDNRYMLDMMEQHRGIFSGVAIVDESQANLSAEMKALSGRGVRGFRLYTDPKKAEAWRGSDGMKRMWSQAADSGLSMCLLTGADALPTVSRMCTNFPRTRVVIDHFARIGTSGSLPSADIDELCRLADHANVFVKTSAFYALGAKKAPYLDLGPMIRKVRDAYGAARLMWASDCPFQVEEGHTYADSIGLIRDRLNFLTADDRQWMLRKTAEKVFFS